MLRPVPKRKHHFQSEKIFSSPFSSTMAGRPECWSKKDFVEKKEGGVSHYTCKHCQMAVGKVTGTRLRGHLEKCEKAPEDVKERAGLKKEPEKKRKADDKPASEQPPAKRPRTSIKSQLGAVPKPSVDECKKIRAAWARFFYCSATPFTHSEHPLFQEALEITRPGLEWKQLSFNRKTVAGPLLDNEYTAITDPQLKALSKADELVILCDAWEDDRKEKLFTILLFHNSKATLFKSGVLKEKVHNAEELKNHLLDLPADILDKIVCILADGDSTAQCSARLFAEEAEKAGRRHCEYGVCGAHSLSRGTNDVVGMHRVAGKDSPYEFNYLHKAVATIAASLRNVEGLRLKWEEKVKATTGKQARLVVIPATTRWTTIVATWSELQMNKEALVLLREDASFVAQLPHIKELLSNWDTFLMVKEVLDSLALGVELLQSNASRISFVIPVFTKVVEVAGQVHAKMKGEEKKKMKAVVERLQRRLDGYAEKPWIVASTVLHPFFLSEMSEAEKTALPRAFGMLDGFKITTPLRKTCAAYLKKIGGAAVSGELLSYVTRIGMAAALPQITQHTTTGLYEKDEDEDVWEQSRVMPVEKWWEMWGLLYPESKLAAFAKRLTGVPASTAESERVFSQMGWQSEKRRNRLLGERVHKLTAVYRFYKEQEGGGGGGGDWWSGLDELVKDIEEAQKAAEKKKKTEERKKEAINVDENDTGAAQPDSAA